MDEQTTPKRSAASARIAFALVLILQPVFC